ncbi:hypothetical protein SAMN06309944_2206 [Micrococcales bacterium KH10]|nr:hypothetical protein SAMN06309944_2206 [Micrococcales bacterium KH10]
MLNEPQVWTIIGVLAATLIGTITLVTQLTLRTITVQITSLRNEMISSRNETNTQFKAIDRRLDDLDRDIQGIVDKVFRKPE